MSKDGRIRWTPERRGYYHTSEASALLQVSTRTMCSWAQQNKVPCFQTLGGHHRYPKLEFDEFVENYWKLEEVK